METLSIDIINPKANALLRDMAKLDLIKIKKNNRKKAFTELLARLRSRASEAPSLEEIAEEVKLARSERYEK